MKNKFVEFVSCEKFVGDLVIDAEEENKSKPVNRRQSVAPKIIVFPPMEEMNDTLNNQRSGSLLRALGRRLSRRSNDAESVTSSSSDGSEHRGDERSSSSTSDSSSDAYERQRRHRSTVSLRRVFQSLSLSARSQSCSPTERPPKKQQQPKRILRPPVTYTYVRGLSGLPTQRVPRRQVHCAASGLHR